MPLVLVLVLLLLLVLEGGTGRRKKSLFGNSLKQRSGQLIEQLQKEGAYVSQSSADNNELEPMVKAVSDNLGQKPQAVLADRGYINGPMIEQIQGQGLEAYVAVSAEAHERRRYDLRCEHQGREKPRPYRAAVLVAMEQKLRSPEGRARYLRRQASVEPVFGIIKKVIGFEQFSLRGLQKVSLEWNLVCTAYNLKRLHKLLKPAEQKPKAAKASQLTPPTLSELLGGTLRARLPRISMNCSAQRSFEEPVERDQRPAGWTPKLPISSFCKSDRLLGYPLSRLRHCSRLGRVPPPKPNLFSFHRRAASPEKITQLRCIAAPRFGV
jgi:hypothetical protein